MQRCPEVAAVPHSKAMASAHAYKTRDAGTACGR